MAQGLAGKPMNNKSREIMLPVKPPRASTPNVNAAMAAKRRAEMPRTTLSEAIARHKTLRYGQPEHTAFLRDGLLGLNQWKAAQA